MNLYTVEQQEMVLNLLSSSAIWIFVIKEMLVSLNLQSILPAEKIFFTVSIALSLMISQESKKNSVGRSSALETCPWERSEKMP